MSYFMTLSSGNVMKPDIMPAQLRAARALLNWSRDSLAEKAGMTARTLARIESGDTEPRTSTIDALRETLEFAGIEFLNADRSPGVRLLRRWIIIQNAPENFVRLGDPISIFKDGKYAFAETPQGKKIISVPPEGGTYARTYAVPGETGTVIEVVRRQYSELEDGHYDYVAFK